MKNLLWLDDARNPHKDGWLVFSPIQEPYDVIWLKTYKEFIDYIIINGLPDGICFDNDLGDFDENGVEYSGTTCAKWLVEYCLDNDKQIPEYNIQSANTCAKDNIKSLLDNYKNYYNNKGAK